MARAEAAVAKISTRLEQAQRSGVLHAFNAEYKRGRLDAAERGSAFMSYQHARMRLQRALTRIAATGIAPGATMETVFDGS